MAPKRRTRASSTDNGLAPGQVLKRDGLADNTASPWAWVDTEAKDISQIQQDHRLMACGLSQRNRFNFCRNKLIPKPKPRTPPPDDDDDIVVISDSDDEPSCSKKVCKKNPNCTNYFDVDIWADRDSTREEFFKAINMVDDPHLLCREPCLPVGLKNLGATCYANASIQVWFRDATFRGGVYQCRPQVGMEDAFKSSPLHQLQITFAALQESTQSVFNPVKLIDSLKLDTMQQQDAQEFSKLFLSHLDVEFKKQRIESLSCLVDNQFQGKKSYGTMCDTCGYRSERSDAFSEIEISFKNNSQLEDCIAAYIQPEKLNGDNKYLCSQCDSHQDATRYTEFQHLPPILNFSLLRFIYDYEKEERKKSKNNISFPVQIDMGRFIGNSAPREAAPQHEQNIYDLRGVLLHKGASAYHGHYEAQVYDEGSKRWFQFNDEVVSKIPNLGKPPQDKVEVVYLHDEGDPKSRPRPKKLMKRRRVTSSEDESETKPSASCPTRSLPSGSSKVKSVNEVSSKDAYMLIYARRTTTLERPSDDLEPPEDVMAVVRDLNAKFEDECERFSQKRRDVERYIDSKRESVINIYQSWSPTAIHQPCVIVSKAAIEEWLIKGAMKSIATCYTAKFEQKELEEKTLTLETIICEHGQLSPENASDMKRLTTGAYDKIVEVTHCRFEKRFQPFDVCHACVEAIFNERLYDIRHPQDVNMFDGFISSAGSNTVCGYWISKQWLKDWRLAKPKMHVTSERDPSPGATEYDKHVRCEHGDLAIASHLRRLIPVEACEMLTTLFPEWEPLPSEASLCEVCNAIVKISQGDRLELRKKAEDEKAKLKHLVASVAADLEVTEVALVPIIFLKAWRQWVSRPGDAERPRAVDNSPFFCEHQHLLFDPARKLDWEHSHSPVSLKDWKQLESLYTTGPLISVRHLPDSPLAHDIPVCEPCRRKRKSDWEEATIFVSIPGTKNDSTDSGSRKNGSRQSKRLRQVKESFERRQFTITKATTVKDIKLMIDAELNISPLLQRLYHDGKELTDNKATTSSLDILRDDLIELREDKEILEVSDTEDMTETKRRKTEEEKGFGGTLLGATSEHSTPSREVSQPIPTINEKFCKACTFSNDVHAILCSMCDTEF